MSHDEADENGALFESRVGTILKDARESSAIALEDVAKTTRIPLRQLENIENSNYEQLPASTYSIGFVKAYAREVGLDQNAIAAQFREEIDFRSPGEAARNNFEPTDPARVPPRSLAWIAAFIGIALILGYGAWRSGWFGESADDLQRLAANGDDAAAAGADDAEATMQSGNAGAGGEAAPASGAVILEATGTVWFRVYDLDTGERIYEAELQPGERYRVPASAENPAIRTGRADSIRVTVGGRAVAPLGPPETVISDVSLLPQNLARRTR